MANGTNPATVSSIILEGSISQQVTLQSAPIGGNLVIQPPNQLPTVNQFMTVSAVVGNVVQLGWGNASMGGGGGSGTVTSVAVSVPSWLAVAGSPVTTSGTIAVTSAPSLTANFVLATPNGAAGPLSPRALVAADIPALPYLSNTQVLAGSVGPVTHQWVNAYNASTGAFTTSQPQFSDIAGSLSLSVISSGGASNGQVMTYNGTVWAPATPSGGGGTPGGTSGELQWNNGGAFAGVSNSAVATNGGLTVKDTGGAVALFVTGNGAFDIQDWYNGATQTGKIDPTGNAYFFNNLFTGSQNGAGSASAIISGSSFGGLYVQSATLASDGPALWDDARENLITLSHAAGGIFLDAAVAALNLQSGTGTTVVVGGTGTGTALTVTGDTHSSDIADFNINGGGAALQITGNGHVVVSNVLRLAPSTQLVDVGNASGTTGQVLTVNGSGFPAWATPASGPALYNASGQAASAGDTPSDNHIASGTATLTTGTVTITLSGSAAYSGTNYTVQVSYASAPGGTPPAVLHSTISSGSSFTITSTDSTDSTSLVSWTTTGLYHHAPPS